jgi:hypothetical protein
VLPSCLSFFKVYIDCSRQFALVFHHVYMVLTLLYSPTPLLTAYSAFWKTIFIHRCIVFQYYSLSFLSSPSSLWRESPQTDPLIHHTELTLL